MVRYQRLPRLQKTLEFPNDTQTPLPPETHDCVVQLVSQLLREIVLHEIPLSKRSYDDERED